MLWISTTGDLIHIIGTIALIPVLPTHSLGRGHHNDFVLIPSLWVDILSIVRPEGVGVRVVWSAPTADAHLKPVVLGWVNLVRLVWWGVVVAMD